MFSDVLELAEAATTKNVLKNIQPNVIRLQYVQVDKIQTGSLTFITERVDIVQH